MDNLEIFNFKENPVRVIFFENNLWWIAQDVCKALAHSDVSMACKRLDDDEKLIQTLFVSGQNRDILTISESGLYSLILTSRKPQAKEFKRWVTKEILPSIRQTGNYSLSTQKQELPQDYLEALKTLVSTVEEKLKLEAVNSALAHQIKENEPKVEYAEKVARSDSSLSFGEYARLINWGRNRLMSKLRDLNILMNNSTLPYQQFIDAGYFECSQEILTNGQLIPFALITGKGQLWLQGKIREQEQLERKLSFELFQGVFS